MDVAITSIALFVVSLDNLVVAKALPVIRTDLVASLADTEWTVNARSVRSRPSRSRGVRAAARRPRGTAGRSRRRRDRYGEPNLPDGWAP